MTLPYEAGRQIASKRVQNTNLFSGTVFKCQHERYIKNPPRCDASLLGSLAGKSSFSPQLQIGSQGDPLFAIDFGLLGPRNRALLRRGTFRRAGQRSLHRFYRTKITRPSIGSP